MARQVQDREDLLREATALEPRMSLKPQDSFLSEEVFLGFRGRALSLYFGSEPVYHFNPLGELRRAFYEGHIIKADHGTLVRWETERTEQSTVQHRVPLAKVEIQTLRADLVGRIKALQRVLATNDYELIGQVPADGTLLVCWNAWIRSWQGFQIAEAPHVA